MNQGGSDLDMATMSFHSQKVRKSESESKSKSKSENQRNQRTRNCKPVAGEGDQVPQQQYLSSCPSTTQPSRRRREGPPTKMITNWRQSLFPSLGIVLIKKGAATEKKEEKKEKNLFLLLVHKTHFFFPSNSPFADPTIFM